MEYVGSMVDPKNTHEYDWNEYLLDLAMKEVMKIQKKRRHHWFSRKAPKHLSSGYLVLSPFSG
jgi:hypothetical protein